VVADSCNPVELTRREWRRVAVNAGAAAVDIEVICADRCEHRRRVVSRKTDLPGLILPTWEAVAAREYHPWTTARIVIDTAGRSPHDCLAALVAELPPIVPGAKSSPLT
jgi:predicted kinase